MNVEYRFAKSSGGEDIWPQVREILLKQYLERIQKEEWCPPESEMGRRPFGGRVAPSFAGVQDRESTAGVRGEASTAGVRGEASTAGVRGEASTAGVQVAAAGEERGGVL